MKKIRYAIEAVLLHMLFFIFRLMPVDAASAAGGFLGRTVGTKLAASRKALRNLNNAMPDLSPEEQKKIIADMWDNLGRVIAEYPHLEYISDKRTVFKNAETVQSAINDGKGAVLFAAHIGNWEVCCPQAPLKFNMPIDITYRAPNNPWVDKLLMKTRSLGGRLRGHPKSRAAGKSLIEAMREKRLIGVLLDQKYNEGLAIPFFGRPAMTNPVFAQICQKYGAPLIPAQCIRTGGAHFEVIAHPPVSLEGSIEDVLTRVNAMMEDWIRQHPEQWLWLHRRWKD